MGWWNKIVRDSQSYKSKKHYITGSTGGLGTALMEEFETKFYCDEVIGLDRPEYDLDKDLDSYVKDDFDVYVNNAHSGMRQVELLYKLFRYNQDRECTIINIGSVSGDGDRKEVNEYAIHKAALEKACTQLQLVESKCRVCLIKPGRMKTKMTDHRSEFPRMDPIHVAQAVSFMINAPQDLNIKSLTIDINNSMKRL